jgi:hypothetical protein
MPISLVPRSNAQPAPGDSPPPPAGDGDSKRELRPADPARSGRLPSVLGARIGGTDSKSRAPDPAGPQLAAKPLRGRLADLLKGHAAKSDRVDAKLAQLQGLLRRDISGLPAVQTYSSKDRPGIQRLASDVIVQSFGLDSSLRGVPLDGVLSHAGELAAFCDRADHQEVLQTILSLHAAGDPAAVIRAAAESLSRSILYPQQDASSDLSLAHVCEAVQDAVKQQEIATRQRLDDVKQRDEAIATRAAARNGSSASFEVDPFKRVFDLAKAAEYPGCHLAVRKGSLELVLPKGGAEAGAAKMAAQFMTSKSSHGGTSYRLLDSFPPAERQKALEKEASNASVLGGSRRQQDAKGIEAQKVRLSASNKRANASENGPVLALALKALNGVPKAQIDMIRQSAFESQEKWIEYPPKLFVQKLADVLRSQATVYRMIMPEVREARQAMDGMFKPAGSSDSTTDRERILDIAGRLYADSMKLGVPVAGTDRKAAATPAQSLERLLEQAQKIYEELVSSGPRMN